MDFGKQFKEGLLTNNPILVQVLGTCPTMAVSTSLFNGIGMLCKFVNLTSHTRQRAEREIGATAMRLRAIRTAVTIKGQGFRPGKRTTRAAALVFFLVTFSKVKKPPGAGRNPASPGRAARTESPRYRPRAMA